MFIKIIILSSRKETIMATAIGVPLASFSFIENVFATSRTEPPQMEWSHQKVFHSLDHGSIRRGFQVYKEVCASCHSMVLLTFRDFINVSHTEEELKAIASEYEIEDEPDENGDINMRPRELKDQFPNPYQNENQAKAMNGGVAPPDLSKIAICRENYEDYIFSLLVGYIDPPEDVELTSTQHFNVYFPGNVIGMAPPLMNGIVEYEDGTPATVSQMAKDLTIFLRFTATPYYDAQQLLYVRWMSIVFPIAIAAYWNYRRFSNVFRTAQIVYKKFNWRK